MSNQKLSDISSAATTPGAGNFLLIEQSSTHKKITFGNLTQNLVADNSVQRMSFVNIQLNTSQVKALNSTPITIVASPGAGKFLQVMGSSMFLDYESATYVGTGGSDGDIHLYVGGKIATTEGGNPILSTVDRTTAFVGVVGTITTHATALTISADNDFVTGDSPLNIYIQYVVVDTN